MPVSACERPDGFTFLQNLTRKPVRGANVRYGGGFGMRYHPVLKRCQMHTGIDWNASAGTPIVGAATGKVTRAEADPQTGNTITIDHGDGWKTRYAHLKHILVKEGACVQRGGLIGTVGATGIAERPHLHFELLHNDSFIDPLIRRNR